MSRYNQYMDNHVGIIVKDARPYLDKIRRDRIPYFTRRQTLKDTGCDIFVQVPNNGIIVELRSELCPADIEEQNWDLCRYTNGAEPPPPAAGATALRATTPTPLAPPPGYTVHPWKMTYASTDPDAAANFTVEHLGATHIQHSSTLSDVCGRVRWVEFGAGSSQSFWFGKSRFFSKKVFQQVASSCTLSTTHARRMPRRARNAWAWRTWRSTSRQSMATCGR